MMTRRDWLGKVRIYIIIDCHVRTAMGSIVHAGMDKSFSVTDTE
jgi:hypothetical protein